MRPQVFRKQVLPLLQGTGALSARRQDTRRLNADNTHLTGEYNPNPK